MSKRLQLENRPATIIKTSNNGGKKIMIGIGCDHTSLEMKEEIKKHLADRGMEVKDYGTYSNERTHYPIYGEKVARAVASGECEKGIVICGTGIGIGISANKVKGIRCVICSEPYSAKLSKQHNNTNMLSFGARVIGPELAKMIVDAWLDAEFEGGRHQVRVDQIAAIDER